MVHKSSVSCTVHKYSQLVQLKNEKIQKTAACTLLTFQTLQTYKKNNSRLNFSSYLNFGLLLIWVQDLAACGAAPNITSFKSN